MFTNFLLQFERNISVLARIMLSFQTKRTFELATNRSRIHQENSDASLRIVEAALCLE